MEEVCSASWQMMLICQKKWMLKIANNLIARLFVSYVIGHLISLRVFIDIIAENAIAQFAKVAPATKENCQKMTTVHTECVTFVILNSQILSLSKIRI